MFTVRGKVRLCFALLMAAGLATTIGLTKASAQQWVGASEDENIRRRYMPVTLTPAQWRAHSDMIYSKFRYAFSRFSFYGKTVPNRLAVGYRNTIIFDGTTSNLSRMLWFLAQNGRSGVLTRNYVNPSGNTEAGVLACEVIALTLNIAYNDERLMPRSAGYDLEDFVVVGGPFKGRTVGEVLNVANHVLGGNHPRLWGLPDCQTLVDVLQAINSDFEFVDYDTFWDRGYLIPNFYGLTQPPHAPQVP